MSNYASLSDVVSMWRELSSSESEMVEQLLTIVSNEIRVKARHSGRDFDAMITRDNALGDVAKSVCVDVVRRYINDNSEDKPAMSQATESALGYSFSGTYLTPGGGLFIKNSELKRLGLKRPRFGVIDLA